MNDEILTPKELAARWKTSVDALAQERYRGQGPHYLKLGSRVRYRLSDILKYEQDCLIE